MSNDPIIIFDSNDADYMAWLARNPYGFVVNTRRQPDPDYMVLHRASCHSISRYTKSTAPGGFTERSYIKTCAGSIEELRDWVRRNGGADGSFSKECSVCAPF